MDKYLKVEKEVIDAEIMTTNYLLVGKFTKDQGIRFIDYLRRPEVQQGRFITLADVKILNPHTKQVIDTRKFLGVNVKFIVTVTELDTLE